MFLDRRLGERDEKGRKRCSTLYRDVKCGENAGVEALVVDVALPRQHM